MLWEVIRSYLLAIRHRQKLSESMYWLEVLKRHDYKTMIHYYAHRKQLKRTHVPDVVNAAITLIINNHIVTCSLIVSCS